MDDIKLYAATNNQLQELLKLTQTFSRDIKMTFRIEKCKTLSTAKRKLELRFFTTQEEETMIAMNEQDIHTCLGHMQTKQIKHVQMKQKLGNEHLKHTKSILNTKLNGKHMIKAINTHAIPVLTFSFGIVKWMPTDLENVQIKMRVLLTRYRIHHPHAAKERLTLPRQIGGRGMTDIIRLHDKQVKLLQTYFLNRQTKSPLHAAVVKADNRYTPMDLLPTDENEFTTDEEYNNKVRRRWSQKALHGRHPHDLSQQYLDIEASNKWLTNADLFAKREGFLTAIQNQVIPTRNYKKYILKQPNIDEMCRRCGKEPETIQQITAACEQLAPTKYTKRHDGVA
jgi:hypothetical protein